MPGKTPPAPADVPPAWRHRFGPLDRYFGAIVFGMAGLIATGVIGWQVHRWAQVRDTERFEVECRQLAQMVQQKMERYESALARLRDVCALHQGRVPRSVWRNWTSQVLAIGSNFPCTRQVLSAPKVTAEARASHELEGRRNFGPNYAIQSTRDNAPLYLPVWETWGFTAGTTIAAGSDLAVASSNRPSFRPALGKTFGWISDRPVAVGNGEVGFWFAIPLTPDELTDVENKALRERPNETESESHQRWLRVRERRATGVLAALISGDHFLRELNNPKTARLVHVQLFTARTPSPDLLLNPSQPPPANPRLTSDHLMPWYGQRWTVRFSSKPLFEAGSLRYRAILTWCTGALLSLAGAAVLTWQTRNRWREAGLADQLRQALDRQERLSRDLHDVTLQSVYGVGLGIQRAQRLLDKRPTDAAGQLADTTLALQSVIGDLRAFIRQADSAPREDVTLGEALQGVVAHLRSASEMELCLDVEPGADATLTPAQSLQLVNIAREALSNSVRHSRAQRVHIRVASNGKCLRLEIQDDGCGFDPGKALPPSRGLRNLEARIGELGATHRWQSAPGQGTQLSVEVPI